MSTAVAINEDKLNAFLGKSSAIWRGALRRSVYMARGSALSAWPSSDRLDPTAGQQTETGSDIREGVTRRPAVCEYDQKRQISLSPSRLGAHR